MEGEQAQGYGDDVETGSPQDKLLGKTFVSVDDAFEYYRGYGSEMGFSVKRSTTRRDRDRNLIVQDFCCSKEGVGRPRVNEELRKRAPRPITKTGCRARVRVVCVGNNRWKFDNVYDVHNHGLGAPNHKPFLRSNRELNDADRAEALALKASGVRTANIYNYFVQSRGGFEKVGFLPRDLYNALQSESRAEIASGDITAVLGFFAAKKDADMGFYMDYTVDEENRLQNLFWADSTSRSDYKCFGDVIAFDTTYKNNAYDRPLMPIVGINHHHQTVVFGIAVLANQTTSTFAWVLTTFLSAMHNRQPTSVVTDGDRAMEGAIKSVIPSARHRLCSWHVSRNAQSNIGDVHFVKQFSRAMKEWWTEYEFEDHWEWMIQTFNVKEHAWVKEKYKTRRMWAQAYLTGSFFGTLTTTQRCESMNASLAIYLKSMKTYVDFIRAIEQGICKMRHKEAQLDYNSIHTKPIISTALTNLEAHAAEVFTRKSFIHFQEELKAVTVYGIAEPPTKHLSTKTYYLNKYNSGGRRIKVEYDVEAETMRCGCKKFESVGFPCAHLLHVLKAEDITRLPDNFILNRWTKNVKHTLSSVVDDDVQNDLNNLREHRFRSLTARTNIMNYVGSMTDEDYINLSGVINRSTADMVEKNKDDARRTTNKSTSKNVRDPIRKKSKQKEKIKKVYTDRKCGICGNVGHNKTTCPELNLNLRTPGFASTSNIYDNGPFFFDEDPIRDIDENNVGNADAEEGPEERDIFFHNLQHSCNKIWEESNTDHWDFFNFNNN